MRSRLADELLRLTGVGGEWLLAQHCVARREAEAGGCVVRDVRRCDVDGVGLGVSCEVGPAAVCAPDVVARSKTAVVAAEREPAASAFGTWDRSSANAAAVALVARMLQPIVWLLTAVPALPSAVVCPVQLPRPCRCVQRF